MSHVQALEADKALLVDALQSIMEVSAGTFTVDPRSIHETAADALADLASGDGSALRAAGNVLVRAAHGAAEAAGWWKCPKTGIDLSESPAFPYIVAAKLMLVVTELAEAVQGHRTGARDDKLPHRPAIEVELADAVLRIGSIAGKLRLDLGGAIAEKSAYNLTRPDHTLASRAAVGGKLY